MNWEAADEVVATAAPPGEATLWEKLTAPYRCAAAAEQLWKERDETLDADTEAKLFGDDGQRLADCRFADEINAADVRGRIRVFSTVEEAKARRRVIGWPKPTNVAEAARLAALRAAHADVPFPQVRVVRDRVRRRYAAQLDLKKFFQQLRLAPGCRPFYCYKWRGKYYMLATVPTGAVGPPIVAQVLLRALCALAIRRSNTTATVESDCMIDNARLTSDDFDDLVRAWAELLHLCATVNATVGDIMPPTGDNYTFLGMAFWPAERQVRVMQKCVDKLLATVAVLHEAATTGVSTIELQSAFGVCLWAAIVAGTPTYDVYHVLKFVRRIGHKDPAATTLLWPSVLPMWTAWIGRLVTATYTYAPAPTGGAVAYTDASTSGWGAVVYHPDGRIDIFGERWSAAERGHHINVLETLAVKKLATRLPRGFHIGTLLVDNTTAICWLRQRRSKAFLANAIIGDIAGMDVSVGAIDYVASAANHADAPSRW